MVRRGFRYFSHISAISRADIRHIKVIPIATIFNIKGFFLTNMKTDTAKPEVWR